MREILLLFFLLLLSSCINKNVINNYSSDVMKISKFFDVEPGEVYMLKKRLISRLEIIKVIFLSKASNKPISEILKEREEKEWEEILVEYGIKKENFENLTEKILSSLSIQ